MNKIKTEIKNLLGKNEMSIYDLGKFLGCLGEFLKNSEFSPIKSANEAIGDVERIVNIIKEMIAKLITLQDEVEKAESALLQRLDKGYANITKKQYEIKKKIEELKPLPEIHISYEMKELIEVVEKFRHFDKEAWQKVVDLAEALKAHA